MRLLITGAGGFLGREIARQAAAHPGVAALRLTDLDPCPVAPGIEWMAGDLRHPEFRARALSDVDVVIHLVACLGGAAEADPLAARETNIDVPLAMIEALRPRKIARLVFASSVAVLGPDLPDPVIDATPVAPVMLYGAHKAMIETALACETRNRRLDGVSLRPSGVIARDGLGEGLKSAFLSRLFWAMRRGEDISLPVGEDSRTWLASVSNVAANFLHAALRDGLSPAEPVTLPALAPRFGDLVSALHEAFPNSRSRVTYAPDAEAVRLFGSMPDLSTENAERAGFSRDASLAALIAGSFPDLEEP